MIEGEVMHRDSLGSEQIIRPGQVNLMTAGNGIAHSEESLGAGSGRVHAAQLWIALPEHERWREPAFQHCPVLPQIENGGFVITLLAGSAFGQTAPPIVYSPLVAIDLVARAAAETVLPLNCDFEHALLCLEGEADVAGERIAPGTLLYLGKDRDAVAVHVDRPARLLLVGGVPFAEDVLLWWNFVARTQDEIQQATADWNACRHFADVPGTQLRRLVAPDISELRLRERHA